MGAEPIMFLGTTSKSFRFGKVFSESEATNLFPGTSFLHHLLCDILNPPCAHAPPREPPPAVTGKVHHVEYELDLLLASLSLDHIGGDRVRSRLESAKATV